MYAVRRSHFIDLANCPCTVALIVAGCNELLLSKYTSNVEGMMVGFGGFDDAVEAWRLPIAVRLAVSCLTASFCGQ